MDETTIIKRFEEFLSKTQLKKLHAAALKGGKSVYIDFVDLSGYDPELAESLLERPSEVLGLSKSILQHFDLPNPLEFIRVFNLPDSCNKPLFDVRGRTTGLTSVTGITTKPGFILTRIHSHRFECNNCGGVFSVLQQDRFKKVDLKRIKCSCGAKSKFNKLEPDIVLFRKVEIEEDLMEITERNIPRTLNVYMEHDLVEGELDRKLLAGIPVTFNGWLEFYEVNEKTGDLGVYFLCNSVEFIDRGWDVIDLKPSDVSACKEIAQSKTLVTDLSHSIIPDIHGEDMVKKALLYQLAGSYNVLDATGYMLERGCLHLALIGPPGTGKTYMSKKMAKFWPIFKFTSAITASGRGLVGTVQHDKDTGKWILVPGVIPMCHKGITVIDELEKMDKEEYGHLNNAMNDLKVTIIKAAQGVLDTDVSILATMNPHGRVFDNSVAVYDQIDLPKDLIDRFDLIFPIMSGTDEDTQKNILEINLQKRFEQEKIKPTYSEELVQKYFAYVRKIKPVVEKSMHPVIVERVMKFMANPNGNSNVSHRIYNVILRLILCSARLHARAKATVADVNNAMDMLIHSFKQQGLLTNDNLYDYAKVEQIDETAMPLRQAILDKVYSYGDSIMPIQEIVNDLTDKYEEQKIEVEIENLKVRGDVYEPKRGFLKLIK